MPRYRSIRWSRRPCHRNSMRASPCRTGRRSRLLRGGRPIAKSSIRRPSTPRGKPYRRGLAGMAAAYCWSPADRSGEGGHSVAGLVSQRVLRRLGVAHRDGLAAEDRACQGNPGDFLAGADQAVPAMVVGVPPRVKDTLNALPAANTLDALPARYDSRSGSH